MSAKVLFVLGIVIIIIVAGITLILSKPANKNNSTLKNQGAKQNQIKKLAKSVRVTVTNNGFEPKDLKIKAGNRVIWTNKTESTVTVNSDNHPTHLLWPFLNLGSFKKGESVSVTFKKAGKYTYHNHYNPSQKGIIIVE